METNDCRGEDTDGAAGAFRIGIARASVCLATYDFRDCSNRYLHARRNALHANI